MGLLLLLYINVQNRSLYAS